MMTFILFYGVFHLRVDAMWLFDQRYSYAPSTVPSTPVPPPLCCYVHVNIDHSCPQAHCAFYTLLLSSQFNQMETRIVSVVCK